MYGVRMQRVLILREHYELLTVDDYIVEHLLVLF